MSEVEGGCTKKSKCISSSTSLDSFHSDAVTHYRLRATSSSTCLFGGKKVCSASPTPSSGSTSNTTSCGPSTSKWNAAHCNRLNFKLHKVRNTLKEAASVARVIRTYMDVVVERVLNILFDPSPPLDPSVTLTPTRIVHEGIIEKSTAKEWIENDPSLQYVIDFCKDAEDKFQLHTASLEEVASLNDYMKLYKSKQIKRGALPEDIMNMSNINSVLSLIYETCAENDNSEPKLDQIISEIMRIIVLNEGLQEDYVIWLRAATRVQFEICGSQVVSETNVQLSYKENNSKKKIPIILSENNSGIPKKDTITSTASLHQKKKMHMEHKNISQVIGQSLSVADESPFENDDYKIVYHISLMGLSQLVITRTHMAKSTLRKIKNGCLSVTDVPSPSFVLEAAFDVMREPIFMFNCLYIPIFLLFKLSLVMYYPTHHGKHAPKTTFKKARLQGKRKRLEKMSRKSKKTK
ncbi:uncharacterized protein LOC144440341 [Glandiceps talaboti]